eukprot:scaffold13793_cov95-Skeletonema_dohrnii-CCMP3373.AAC.3
MGRVGSLWHHYNDVGDMMPSETAAAPQMTATSYLTRDATLLRLKRAFGSYRHRYNDVGDMMPSETAAAPTMTATSYLTR